MSNLASNILTLIERRVGQRGWRGMKECENIIIYLCAAETGELDKYFPTTKESDEEHNYNLDYRRKVETKVNNFLRSIK